MAKKKGPPYNDDPGCTYIVICDPWPGNKFGKDRDRFYYDCLGTWVYFMLNKKYHVEYIYTVNTRADVIVQLPESIDVTPILGAHKWRSFLSHWGNRRDLDRVSYVFEYKYRDQGQPESHNWLAHEPTRKEPPAELRFPVRHPYPRPSWASPAGRSCKDLARQLPSTRQRTPTPPPPPPPPDSSGFEPYEQPSHYPTARDATEDDASKDDIAKDVYVEKVKTEIESQPPLFKTKLDPYEEEEAALDFVKQEPADIPLTNAPLVKQETVDVHVKAEAVETKVPDPEPPAPSGRMLAMFAALTQVNVLQEASTSVVQPEMPEPVTVSEPQYPANPPDLQSNAAIRVKPEPEEAVLPPASQPTPPRPQAMRTSDPRTRDPRFAHKQGQPKRVKEEEDEAVLKRVKMEPRD